MSRTTFRISLLLCLTVWVGCKRVATSESETDTSPAHRSEELVGILVDMHLVEGALQQIRPGDRDSMATLYYWAVAEQHGLSLEELLQKVEHSTVKTSELEKIYQQVVDSLNRLEMKIQDEE